MALECNAQVWREIIPIKSTRVDVGKMKLDSNDLPNGTTFIETPKDIFSISYYESGCVSPDYERSRLAPGVVIQIKDTPKEKHLLSKVTGGYGNLQKLVVDNSSNDVHFSLNTGFFIVVERDTEFVREIFYLPERLDQQPECLLALLDPMVKEVIRKTKKDTQPIIFKESTSLEYPVLSAGNKNALRDFLALLEAADEKVGAYVVVYSDKYSDKETEKNRTYWIRSIQNYLRSLDANRTLRIQFIDGGCRDAAVAELFIWPLNMGIPPIRPGL